MTEINRTKLAEVIEDRTPFNLEQFERIHGPVKDREATMRIITNWRALRTGCPDATLWKIRDTSGEAK